MGDGSDGDGDGMAVAVSFPQFSFLTEIDQTVIFSGVRVDRLKLQTTRDDGRETLTKLAFIITQVKLAPIVGRGLAEIWLVEDSCTWLHQARKLEETRYPQDTVHILHRHDQSSILILRNTDDGLLIILTGRWMERVDEIVALAAKWSFRLTQNLDNDPGKVRQLKEVFDDSDGKL